MRKSFPFAAAAALLVSLNPVYAATSSRDDAGKMASPKDGSATTGPAAPAGADDSTTPKVIILDPDSLEALPNPYANPGPRMISDVWAMRT